MRVTMSYLTFSSITGVDAIGVDIARRLAGDFMIEVAQKGMKGESLSRDIRAHYMLAKIIC